MGLLASMLIASGLGLSPGDAPAEPPPTPPSAPSSPAPFAPLGGAAATGLLLLAVRRRGGPDAMADEPAGPGDALGLEPPDDAIIVFVPGHGQGPGESVFRDLLEMMEIDPESAYFFDYRWAGGQIDQSDASRDVSIDFAAPALNAYIAGLAALDRPIYLVGFSKGGATVAEVIADWDDGEPGAAGSVTGAALLDPPMASGTHGWWQSVGRHFGAMPDDGGYDPEICNIFAGGCRDRRDHLGEAAGVEVVVIKNPKTPLTNFGDHPDGLRVYDAPDDGPGIGGQILRNPFDLPGRISEAHESVLHNPDVARCLVDEMSHPGSCSLDPPPPQYGPPPVEPPMWRSVV